MTSVAPRKLFKLHECVGRGNFGDVYRATNRATQEVVAIKIVNLDESDEDLNVLIQEIRFLSQLRSPFITRYYSTHVQNVTMWISMEYCGGGSCADLLKYHRTLDETAVAFITRDVLRGLEYLHAQLKVHRDIKAANILLSCDGSVKLADFGVSGQLSHTQIKRDTFVGTPFWMAPEVILRKTGYDQKADLWSLGITVIELLKGAPPHVGSEPMKVLFEIPTLPAPQLGEGVFGDLVRDFLRYCLVKNPANRTPAAVLLRHRYLRTVPKRYSLVPLIEQKNRWAAKAANKKRPRLSLDSSPPRLNPIDWRFTQAPGGTPPAEPPSPTLFRALGVSDGVSKATETLASPTPHKTVSPTTDKTVSPTTGGTSPSTPPPPIEAAPNEVNILLHCLAKVASRAKTEATQDSVRELGNLLQSYEGLQPGICDALAEELCLYLNAQV